MAQATDEELVRRLKKIKLDMQRGLELIGFQEDVPEGQRLLTIADRELMLLIREIDEKAP
jgi:hypothetical protein